MAAQEVGLAQVPNYREPEIEAHARRTTRTSYHVHRSRRRAAMKRRAAVRDSRRAYRIQVIQIQPLNEYRNDVKGALVPKLLAVRVRKTAAEAAIEQLSECDVNPSAGDGSVGALINLTSSGSDGEDETEADKCASVSVHATGLPVAAEVLIDLTSDGLGDEGQGDSEELNEHRGDPEHAPRDLPTSGEYQWPRDIVSNTLKTPRASPFRILGRSIGAAARISASQIRATTRSLACTAVLTTANLVVAAVTDRAS